MSFSVWFRQWFSSFITLLTVNSKKPKSNRQREKERQQRRESRRSRDVFYRKKKKPVRRRRSYYVRNLRLIRAVLKFTAFSLSILLLPFGLIDWGRKSASCKKASNGDGSNKSAQSVKKGKNSHGSADASGKKEHAKLEKPKNKHSFKVEKDGAVRTAHQSFSEESDDIALKADTSTEDIEKSNVQNGNAPKSTPKNPADRYVKKRMYIDTSSCEKSVLDSLTVGSYFDIEEERGNANGKDLVKLLYDGQKIGRIQEKDSRAFLISISLAEKIYGVITEIREADGQTEYEFEAWFGST